MFHVQSSSSVCRLLLMAHSSSSMSSLSSSSSPSSSPSFLLLLSFSSLFFFSSSFSVKPLPPLLRLGTVEGLQHVFLGLGGGSGNLVVRAACDVGAAVSVDTLRLALQALQLRHPLLQYRTERRGSHVFAVHAPDVPLRLAVDEQEMCCASPEDVQAKAAAAHAQLGQTDFRNGPQAAMAWFATDAVAELVLAVAHAISDARSVLMLALELLQLMAVAAALEALPTPENLLAKAGLPPQPVPALLAERLHPRARGAGGMLSALWAGIGFARLASKLQKRNLFFPPLRPPPDTPRANEWTRRSCKVSALRAACRAHDATVHHLLATCLALAFVEELAAAGRVDAAALRNLPMMATVDLRPRQEPPCTAASELVYVVGSSLLDVPLPNGGVAELQSSADAVWALANRARQLMDAQIASHNPWKIVRMFNAMSASAMERRTRTLLEDGSGAVLANAGPVPLPDFFQHAVIRPTGLFYQLVVVHCLLSVAATSFNDELNVVFSWGRDRADAAVMTRVADRTMAHLLRIVPPP